MGEIERVQRITAPLRAEQGHVNKADEARDQKREQQHREEDVIELHTDAPATEEEAAPQVAEIEPEEPRSFDIAV